MSNPNRLTRRDFLKLSGVAALGLTAQAACARLVPAPGTPPTPGASPTPTNPNVLRPTPTTVPGETIQGETLAMGGAQLRLSSMSGAEIAKAVRGIGPEYKTLQVLVNDQGFSDSFIGFTGENQTQVALLAQGPKGFIWDSKKGIWNSPSGDLVFIPDVILPGSFDEIKNTAGPSALADHVFLAQNNLGYLQAGVIYPADVVAKLREKSVPIELLADGSGRGLFLGNQKIIPLEKGQSVERDTNGDLILKSADGSYKRMITSWGNVTGKEQLYQVGAFAGPIEAIPEVLYPGEKLTQEAIVPFANAFGVKPEEVGNLTPQLLTGVDGKQFVVLTTGDLAATTTFDESTTPLMIAEQGENGEWSWNNITTRKLSDITKTNFLVSLPEDWYFKGGRNNELVLASENFNGVNAQGLYLLWQKSPEQRTKSDFALHDKVFDFAQINNMVDIMGQHLLWGYPQIVPDWLKQKSKQELLTLINQHITQVVTRYPNVNIWNVVNEPYAKYEDGSTDFWGQKFGPNDYSWIETAFLSANKANPNAKLILNDFGAEIPGSTGYNSAKFDRLLAIGAYLKQNNIPISGIGFQMHIYAKDFSSPERVKQLMNNFAENVKKLQLVYGEVMITELDVIENGPNQDYNQAQAYESIVNTALSNNIKVVDVFGLTDKDSWKKDQTPLLFDSNLNPKSSYFAVLKALLNSLSVNK